MGVNLANDKDLQALADRINAGHQVLERGATGAGRERRRAMNDVTNPADRRDKVGQWQARNAAQVERALVNARRRVQQLGSDARPRVARRSSSTPADLMEARMPELIALCVKEAGKSLSASVAEVREAVDFCRYYAVQSRKLFGQPEKLPGRPANPTNCSCMAAACSSASARGIFRWRISWVRSPPRWRPATRDRQAGRADHADAHLGGEAAARSRRAGDVLQFLPGDGATVGAALDPRSSA
jgi:RHH-type proline utilization regulon transcriptional repressor/proline dehydrogenase/delta 1-pyrroline-5-carboxylate dehydrogenase